MKNIILILILSLFSTQIFSMDLYGDVYRFGEPNYTGKGGLAIEDYNVEYSFSDSTFAFGGRKYLSFINVEIGSQFMFTNMINGEALDYRVIDVEGGNYITINPYLKVGSKLFGILKLDESNKVVVLFGFNVF